MDLDASVPFSTSVGSKASNPQTQIHARNLRVLLETLDEILHVRHDLVKRAERLAEADDIQPRIMKAATGFERWVEVQPAMFEDVSDEEIAKYDKFLQGLREGEKKQNEILEAIKVCRVTKCAYIRSKCQSRSATNPSCSLEGMTHLSRSVSMRCNPLTSPTTSTRKSRATWRKG